MADREITDAVARAAQPLTDTAGRFDRVLELAGEFRLVLLGEASHGTHEFYEARAEITRRLISEKGFDAVAVEADWPDALRVSRYVQGGGDDADGNAALGSFQRFPRWMWRNREVCTFVDWLRQRNDTCPPDARAGFYGLDLYSLRASMDAVVRYLAGVDPEAERRARARYACFDHIADDPQRYGFATTFGMSDPCEQAVLRQLAELSRDTTRFLRHDGVAAADELFYAQQNARVAVNAEAYYRSMFAGRNESWNRRDAHMGETLQALANHLGERLGRPAKIAVWAHNSHLGDARATEMGEAGELNLGQLAREQFGAGNVLLVGFTTHTGSVTAASEWDAPAEHKRVRESHPDSFERVFHDCGIERFVLEPGRVPALRGARRLERAIGVIYLPDTERLSHYFHAQLANQFDVLIHLDRTRALEPLEPPEDWTRGMSREMETYPTGI
ncbi:erythromycin esterase family protein [Aromatoleum buckelii]|uniref:Erythromycin esterase family protein n=1 Tax=Aromatoleum buckelii TaxID=200254 RepID=A0ABX1N057_9RHOO|nr:erythromycin esterase family protein [Aromatoleum buckelii]MCK0509880.1 erythromycin esterase family protein [Aromatoleum buckelii]